MSVLEDQTYISEQPRHKRNTITQKIFKKSDLKGPTQYKKQTLKRTNKDEQNQCFNPPNWQENVEIEQTSTVSHV